MNSIEHLLAHKDAAKYDACGKKVSALLQFDKDKVTNFATLQKHRCLTMLSKAPGRDKLQITFNHKVTEDSFFSDSSKLIGLVGLGARASPVEFPDDEF